MKFFLPLVLSVLLPGFGFAQNVAPNPSFEVGTNQPVSWALTGASGQLQPFGHSGTNCINITSDGSIMSRWYTFNTPAAFGETYAVRFWMSSSNAVSGSSFGGFSTVYSDFPLPGNAWTNFSLVAWIPSVSGFYLNIGQVVVNGSVYFDDVEMYRVTLVHKAVGAFALGAGEKLVAGRYTFQSHYGDLGGSASRCLLDANTSFASFRWYMNAGSTLLYRHNAGGLPMTNVTVKGGIWNYNNIADTSLQMEASTNGSAWVPFGALTGGGNQLTASVPASLLPATNLFIRLKSTNAFQFSLTNYVFTADVATNLAADGVTYFVEQHQSNSVVAPVSVLDVATGQVLTVTVANPGAAQTFSFRTEAQLGGVTNVSLLTTNLGAAQTNSLQLFLSAVDVGENIVTISGTNGAGSNIFHTRFVMNTTAPAVNDGLVKNLAPNPSFEVGTNNPANTPAGWSLSSGTGNWDGFGRTGAHSVSLTGDGASLTRWNTYGAPVAVGGAYNVRFWTSCSNSPGGNCFGGFSTVYNDFPLPHSDWTNYSMVAWIPNAPSSLFLNLAQVSVLGTINFDDVEVYPVTPVQKIVGSGQLGAGEKLSGGKYIYQSGYGGYAGSYSRCLQDATTSFATFRWYMNPGSALLYRHDAGGLPMTNITLKVGIWNYNNITTPTVLFEASTNGQNWFSAGAMTGGAATGTATVPTNLLPTAQIYIRLRSTNAAQFSLTNYVFTADVSGSPADVDGATYFLEQRYQVPIITPIGFSDTPTGQVMTVTMLNPTAIADTFSIYSSAESSGTVIGSMFNVNLGAGQSNTVNILLPSAGLGDNNLAIAITNSLGSNVFNTSFVVKAPVTADSNTGLFGNLAPNPSFEIGTNAPAQWFGQSAWENFGHTGSRCTSITSAGFGTPRVYTLNCPIDAGTTYSVHYWTMASNAVSGSCFGAFNSNYRDYGRPPEYWVKNTMVGYMPNVPGSYLNLGLVTINGTIYFDDVEVYRTIPVQKLVGTHRLGAGETVTNGQYNFHVASSSGQYSDYAGNYARSLVDANCAFAGFRWYMNQGSYVIHKHELDGSPMTNAVISGQIWNYNAITNTSLEVEVGVDGDNWQPSGLLTNNASQFIGFSFNAPTNLFPTPVLYVRFKSSNPLQFSFTDYSFSANIPTLTDVGSGETYFFEQKAANPGFLPQAIVDRPAGRVITLQLPNATSLAQSYSVQSQAQFNGHLRTWNATTNVAPFSTNVMDVVVPTAGFGENVVSILVTNSLGAKVYDNSFTTWVSILTDDSYGERLPSPASSPVWWCGPTYKVGRSRAQPLATNTAVHISAARNEYEPFQLALRPSTPLTNVTVGISDFVRNGGGGTILTSNVTMNLVDYVPITELYTAVESSLGDTADPLLPITGPFSAPANTNTTVWFTVKTPKDVPAGNYDATVTITHAAGSFTVPVQLKIYNFAISDATHHDSPNNVVVDTLWHQPANDNDRRAIMDLYMADMARHRQAPYLPAAFRDLQWNYVSSNSTFTFNFTNFDTAMSLYLDDLNVSSFQMFKENQSDFGLGPYFRITNVAGQQIFNPAYKAVYPAFLQPIWQHVIERGWADKAYSYWVDEPALDSSPADLAYTKEGMQLVGDSAPGLKRMLPANTYDFPKADLFGLVDIWSPGFDPFIFHTNRLADRQAVGDEVWPYCYVRPFSPWPNNFIDMPAASPRIRQWIAEKLGWDGELYWGINYYFNVPGLGPRNPWTTPFVKDASGFKEGNSDGALVYPPVKQYPTNTVIAGPIDSVRWENLREGAEDREYFWLLKTLIADGEARLGASHPSVVAAKAARDAALAFVPWPPAYPYEPDSMQASRDAIAQAIETLGAGRPLIANQPKSKAARTGANDYLQCEVLGWPLPALQWQHAGTNLPGATSARLLLNNVTPDMSGPYQLIATNISGSVTSAVVSYLVYDDTTPPQIIRHPSSLSCTNGGRAVFGVFASSTTPLTYQWLFNGTPIAGATNLTLVLNNLVATNAGYYSANVSNTAGAATSAAAQLYLPVPPTLLIQPAPGGLQINISSLYATGQIQFSTNLVNWQTLTNLPPSTTTINFVDQSITNSPYRYYRVLLPP